VGKIIQTMGGKIGHVVGIKDGHILCETLDEKHDFVNKDGTREVFACHPKNITQIGYLDPIKL